MKHTIPDKESNQSEMKRGLRLGFPIFLGYFPVGIAFGILAVQQGFSPVLATICSATALAGAGQFIALSMMLATGSATATLFATTIVNMRYILFAAALSPHLKGLSLAKLSFLGFTLTDESFAVNITDLREKKASFTSMSGVGIIAWLGWVSGTLVGAFMSDYMGDPTRFGVDFAMAAMFSALLIALAESLHHVITGIIAAAIVVGLALLNGSGILAVNPNLFIVLGSLTAATIASFMFKDDSGRTQESEIPLITEEEMQS